MPQFIPQHTPSGLDDFTSGYITAVEWLLPEDDDQADGVAWADANGFAPEAVEQMCQDCAEFTKANAEALGQYEDATGCDLRSAGIDFWLTRNGHGSGFWDRGDAPCLDALTDAAHAAGSQDPYVGDDGLIYVA